MADSPGLALPPLAPGARLRWSLVGPIVTSLQPREILELGCGGGAFAVRLAGLTQSLTAVEPDDESYELAASRLASGRGTIVHGDHRALPPEAQFDLVCAFEVLEHLADDAAALTDWAPLVRPGGHLLLSTPAGPERMGAWDEAVGHFRRYSAELMTQKLTTAGFTDVRVILYGWPLGYALEGMRNVVARRRSSRLADQTVVERTASSARQLQPQRRFADLVVRVGTWPFTRLQRATPTRGTALIALARRP